MAARRPGETGPRCNHDDGRTVYMLDAYGDVGVTHADGAASPTAADEPCGMYLDLDNRSRRLFSSRSAASGPIRHDLPDGVLLDATDHACDLRAARRVTRRTV
ncbi:hypothetical protein AB0C13_30825 [Streptomyces sp. NPDC049099]|uniref:hypothetical protein n=1 Tax=Streptomyces sp. NPDC049099 TaxID=3155768 RepID=UPI0034357488